MNKFVRVTYDAFENRITSNTFCHACCYTDGADKKIMTFEKWSTQLECLSRLI